MVTIVRWPYRVFSPQTHLQPLHFASLNPPPLALPISPSPFLMLSESQFRDLVSGQWRGALPTTLRAALSLLEMAYGWAVERRNRQYECGAAQVNRPECPVISVGNITVGGTGKTPMVASLANWFLARQIPVTLISRGYGSRSGRPNDEALELAARLPHVPHLQNPDRVAAARDALRANSRQVLILDDAFQHRRIARDLDIVLVDALEPFGYEHLLPRGFLREPIESLARAQVVALSRSDAVNEARRREIESRVRSVAPRAIWLELVHRPVGLVAASGARLDLSVLRGRPIAAFCGIGNPAGFRHTLGQVGFTLRTFLELPDHCPYGPRELDRVQSWLQRLPYVEDAVCTRKDLVKLRAEELAGKRIWALEIELAIVRGQDALRSLLEVLAQQVRP